MTVRLKLFAGLDEALGLPAELLAELDSVAAALAYLSARTDEQGRAALHQTVILLNGRNVAHLAGRRTRLAAGDTLSLFPPVGGG